jgi:hypothetical protein
MLRASCNPSGVSSLKASVNSKEEVPVPPKVGVHSVRVAKINKIFVYAPKNEKKKGDERNYLQNNQKKQGLIVLNQIEALKV